MDWLNLPDELPTVSTPDHIRAFEQLAEDVGKKLGNVFMSKVGDSPYIVEMIFLPPDFIFNLITPDEVKPFKHDEAKKMMRYFITDHPEYSLIAHEHETGRYRLILLNDKPATFENFVSIIQDGVAKKKKANFNVSIQGEVGKSQLAISN